MYNYYGWEDEYSKKDGEMSGTEGQSKRIEAIKIKLGDSELISDSASIKYQVHVQDYGWMGWKKDGELAGTVGEAKRIEAIKISLEKLDGYSVIYRTHIQDHGWSKWKANGEVAGTEGESKRIEAIEIKIIKGVYEHLSLNVTDNNNTVNEYLKDNKHYLFIPKSMDITNLSISYKGNVLQTSAGVLDANNKKINGDFSKIEDFTVKMDTGDTENICIIQSDVPALHINLDDNVTQSTLNGGNKKDKYKASLNITGGEQEDYNINDNSVEIRGRGNNTWRMPKKPYQIKLSKKQNLFGIGKEKSKKWVLIANYQDPTLLKNKIENDLCVNSNLSNIPNSKFIDLYINGDYVGNYLLCDKIETGKGRVELKNDDGVLVELDNAYYNEEEYYFKSQYSTNYYTIKEFSNDDLDSNTKNKVMNEFKEELEKFEKVLYSNDSKWEDVEKLIDVESFAKYYLITELAENPDSYFSSTYIYKDGKNDVIHMGPTWDYDGAFGYSTTEFRGRNPEIDFTIKYAWYNNYMTALYKYPQFAKKVKEIYENNLKQHINNINVKKYAESIKKASRINSIVWYSENEYKQKVEYLDSWLNKRINYFKQNYKYDTKVSYTTHVQNVGWQMQKNDGETAGTVGQGLRLEGIKIDLGKKIDENISIQYQTHVENIGWQDWKQNGELAGTTGRDLRLEALRIKLTGENKEEYKVAYRVHVQDIGWQDWRYDGAIAGTVGQSKRIEAIEIKILKKPKFDIDYTYNSEENTVTATIKSDKEIKSISDSTWTISQDKKSCQKTYNSNDKYNVTVKDCDGIEQNLDVNITQVIERPSKIKYYSHVSDIGWEDKYSRIDGETSGTTGKGKRLEAIRISLGNSDEILPGASIKYQVHVQNYGWMDWKKDGEIAGTTGEEKRIEAIKIKLEGMENYTVQYKTYIQGIGWQKWVSDSQLSGTTGSGLRIEAIQIQVLKKEEKIIEPEAEYQVHISNRGWQDTVSEDKIAGTTGQASGIDSLKINLKGINAGEGIKYQSYIAGKGWQDEVSNGQETGKANENKNIEAIKIKLENLEDYSVEYRVHVSNYGWQKWKKNGEIAGVVNKGIKIEAIQIRVVYKGSETLEPEVSYKVNIQQNGWDEETNEGVVAGTEGRSLRIEGLKINLLDSASNAKVLYRAHVEDIGWQGWTQNGGLAGTDGKNKRIEAIQIKLEGLDEYTVEYKVHIQDYGWTDWMIDGETAGTVGKSKRIEAIQIRIVPKYYRKYFGIDVSEFNGSINWQAVKNSGVQFAVIRCGYRGYRTGAIVKDARFDENIRNASAVGIKVGIYFFSQAVSISEAIVEANYAADLANRYGCVSYPIAIDTEYSGADRRDGRADNLSVAVRTNVMAAFCNQIISRGYKPMVYASRDWLYNNLQVSRLTNYETWLAHYTNNPDRKSNYIYDYTMWQYTSSGSIPGIGGRVDLNLGYKRY